MKNVFIDCGAHWGETSCHWAKKHYDYKIFMFEPNPEINVTIPDGAILYRAAVWIHNCRKKFYFDGKKGEGCSLLKHKVNVLRDNPAIVECIDFDEWMRVNINPIDYVVLKMDIEGAEYDVLPKMMRSGTINYVDVLYAEFHCKKIDMDKRRHKAFYSELKSIPTLTLKKEYRKAK